MTDEQGAEKKVIQVLETMQLSAYNYLRAHGAEQSRIDQPDAPTIALVRGLMNDASYLLHIIRDDGQ